MLTLPGAIGYAGVLVREHRRLTEQHDDELRDALAPARRPARAQHRLRRSRSATRATMFAVLLDGIHDIVVGRVADTAELARLPRALLHRRESAAR